MTRQLALALPVAVSAARADVIEDASNAEALAWLDRPGEWPLRRLALWGAAGSGKTHLARAAARERDWRWMEGPALRGLPEPAVGTVVDDADCLAEERALLHLINLCAERGEFLLLTGRAPPARWAVALPDLASRLRATQATGLAGPGDDLLRALLAKHFADRQLLVPADLPAWLLARLPREAAAVAEVAARLDRAALALGRRVTRGLAREVLAEMEAEMGEDWPGMAERERDGSETERLAPSTAQRGLL